MVITGDVGSGKTRLLAGLVDEAVSYGGLSVAVLDLAPEISTGLGTVGVSVRYYSKMITKTKYLRPETLFAPRLQGRSSKEVLNMASRNAEAIKPLLSAIASEPPDVLFVDDLTVYLQAGRLETLINLILRVGTFIATAYKGEKLLDDKGSGLSVGERLSLEVLLGDARLGLLEVDLGTAA